MEWMALRKEPGNLVGRQSRAHESTRTPSVSFFTYSANATSALTGPTAPLAELGPPERTQYYSKWRAVVGSLKPP